MRLYTRDNQPSITGCDRRQRWRVISILNLTDNPFILGHLSVGYVSEKVQMMSEGWREAKLSKMQRISIRRMTEMFPPAVLYRLFKWLHHFVLCLFETIIIAGCQPCDIWRQKAIKLSKWIKYYTDLPAKFHIVVDNTCVMWYILHCYVIAELQPVTLFFLFLFSTLPAFLYYCYNQFH